MKLIDKEPVVIAVPPPTNEPIEPQRCEGDHYFEELCLACGAAKPSGPCAVCPHMPPQWRASAEHFARRPCHKCGSSKLRSVRVKAAP